MREYVGQIGLGADGASGMVVRCTLEVVQEALQEAEFRGRRL